jgi:cytochrome c5
MRFAAVSFFIGEPGSRNGVCALFAGMALLLHAAAFAEDFDRTGAAVAEAGCMPCHGSGANGAPRVGDQNAWEPLARRPGSLTKSALEGIRNMPAHGSGRGFSDAEIAAATAYLLALSGYRWIDSDGSTRLVRERTGEQIVATRCIDCHGTGKYDAPKIGDRGGWLPSMRANLNGVVQSTIEGHGRMRARGGMDGLTETEVRAAIVQMFRAAGWP